MSDYITFTSSNRLTFTSGVQEVSPPRHVVWVRGPNFNERAFQREKFLEFLKDPQLLKDQGAELTPEDFESLKTAFLNPPPQLE
jgi:hypothetical protein